MVHAPLPRLGMPVDPAALRPLLAGPVLRRVESDLVSVWIATSRACNVSLLLFDGADIVASRNEQDDLRAKWVSAPQPTRAGWRPPARPHRRPGPAQSRRQRSRGRHGTTLEANHTFSYDLQLIERADPTQTHNLRSLGLVADPTPIGYDPEELPSFRTCPQELDRLVILHGSCRQLFAAPPLADDPAGERPIVPRSTCVAESAPSPDWPRERPTVDSPRHDGKPYPFPPDEYPQLPKRDGMVWIDALIEARGPSPMVQRPHQLFLTGDQIYADQPPPPLLPALNTLARMLVGEEELGAEPTGTVFKAATLENFPRDSAAIPSGAAPGSPRRLAITCSRSASSSPTTCSRGRQSSGSSISGRAPMPRPVQFDPSNDQLCPQDWLIRFLYKEEPVDAELVRPTTSPTRTRRCSRSCRTRTKSTTRTGTTDPPSAGVRPATRRARRVVFPAGA